jgi:hypothetical protein
LPMPLTLYMVVMSISIGLPDEVTLWDLRSMAEKAVWRPYCFGGCVVRKGFFLVLLVRGCWDIKTYPLRLKLLSALGYGDGVGEDCVVLP